MLGTEEEYTELDVLLQNLSDMQDDFNIESTEASAAERKRKADGSRIRDLAMKKLSEKVSSCFYALGLSIKDYIFINFQAAKRTIPNSDDESSRSKVCIHSWIFYYVKRFSMLDLFQSVSPVQENSVEENASREVFLKTNNRIIVLSINCAIFSLLHFFPVSDSFSGYSLIE